MTRKYVHGGTTQGSLLSVETLEDRSVPSTTTLDALDVQWSTATPELAPATQAVPDPTPIIAPLVEAVVPSSSKHESPPPRPDEDSHHGKLNPKVKTEYQIPAPKFNEVSEQPVASLAHTTAPVRPVAPPAEQAPSPPPEEMPPLPIRGEGQQDARNETTTLPRLAAEGENRSSSALDNNLQPAANPATEITQAKSGAAGAPTMTSPGEDLNSSSSYYLPPLGGGMVLEVEVVDAEPVSSGHPRREHGEQEPAPASPGTADLLEAPLPELGGLEGFLAGLEQLVLPAGNGVRGWLLATALAGMACELARQQMRTSRRKDEDSAEALSWSLALGGCS